MDLCENALGEWRVFIFCIRYLPPAVEMSDVLANAETVLIYSEALQVSTFADDEEQCCKAADIGNNKP